MNKVITTPSKIMLAVSMAIFGTIGIFRRSIPLPSSLLAMARGFIGMLFLLMAVKITGQNISKQAIKNNFVSLLLSGIFLGVNWILLFEAYNYTSVATATLCYYMAPVMVVLVSPVLFREKLTVKKIICMAIAIMGMVLVSGMADPAALQQSGTKGILLGLGAAVFYALLMIFNKTITNISAYDKTIVQLAVAAVIMLPYVLLTEDIFAIQFTPLMITMLIVVGIIHTGVAYRLYFGSMKNLKAHTIALYSYIDPALAILLSAFVLHEPMGLPQLAGTVMVLGATMFSELTE